MGKNECGEKGITIYIENDLYASYCKVARTNHIDMYGRKS